MFLSPSVVEAVSHLASLVAGAFCGAALLVVEGMMFLPSFASRPGGAFVLCLLLGAASVLTGLVIAIGELADG